MCSKMLYWQFSLWFFKKNALLREILEYFFEIFEENLEKDDYKGSWNHSGNLPPNDELSGKWV